MAPQPTRQHFDQLEKFLAGRNLNQKDAEVLGTLLTRDLHLRMFNLEREVRRLEACRGEFASGMSGDMTLALVTPGDFSFIAADVNAAADDKEFVFGVRLGDKADGGLRVLSWFAGQSAAIVITPTENVADPLVTPPSIVGTPIWVDGCCIVRMKLNRSGVYAPADFVEVQFQINAAEKLLDHTILPAGGVKKKVVFT